MDFGQPNVEIGQKMANGQLLFLTLHITYYPMVQKILIKFLALISSKITHNQ